MVFLDGLFGDGPRSVFDGSFALGGRLLHVGVSDLWGPGDQPDDQARAAPWASAGGAFGPAVDAAAEDGSDVVDSDQVAAGDEEWEGSVDVETSGFGVAEGGQ